MYDEQQSQHLARAKHSLDACLFEGTQNHKLLLALSFDPAIDKSCFWLSGWETIDISTYDYKYPCAAPYFWHTSEFFNGPVQKVTEHLNVQGFVFNIFEKSSFKRAQQIAKRQSFVYRKAQHFFEEFKRVKAVVRRPDFMYSCW